MVDKGFKILVYNDVNYRSKRSFFSLLSEKLSVWSTESEKFPPSVISLVTVAHWIPAAVAALSPFSESSRTNASDVLISKALHDAKNRSGAGLILFTSSRLRNFSK